MRPPKGVNLPDVNGKRQCYLVKKSIYGLKQVCISVCLSDVCTKLVY